MPIYIWRIRFLRKQNKIIQYANLVSQIIKPCQKYFVFAEVLYHLIYMPLGDTLSSRTLWIKLNWIPFACELITQEKLIKKRWRGFQIWLVPRLVRLFTLKIPPDRILVRYGLFIKLNWSKSIVIMLGKFRWKEIWFSSEQVCSSISFASRF